MASWLVCKYLRKEILMHCYYSIDTKCIPLQKLDPSASGAVLSYLLMGSTMITAAL